MSPHRRGVVDTSQGSVVASGHAFTSYDVDFTVKVEATGLTALTPYSYQFANCAKPDQVSPVGKTRTAPGKFATDIPTQKFAVYSCANWPNGFFNSYSGPVTNGDSEYVIALGDYIVSNSDVLPEHEFHR